MSNANPQGNLSLDLPEGMFRVGPKAGEVGIDITVDGNPAVEEVSYSEQNGLGFFEGDILLGKAADLKKPDAKGLVRKGENFRWPGGKVFYVVRDAALQERVDVAIREHWTKRTPITFEVRTTQVDFISFEDQGGCFSSVGRQGGEQVISLAPGCTVGSTIHEIGHALGLWHEQSRGDRDKFVTVKVENIDPQQLHNFDKHVFDGIMVGIYDFGSIMHYPAKAFSRNNQTTIVVKQSGQAIGQRNGLSRGDILAIKEIYPTLDWSAFPIPPAD